MYMYIFTIVQSTVSDSLKDSNPLGLDWKSTGSSSSLKYCWCRGSNCCPMAWELGTLPLDQLDRMYQNQSKNQIELIRSVLSKLATAFMSRIVRMPFGFSHPAPSYNQIRFFDVETCCRCRLDIFHSLLFWLTLFIELLLLQLVHCIPN